MDQSALFSKIFPRHTVSFLVFSGNFRLQLIFATFLTRASVATTLYGASQSPMVAHDEKRKLESSQQRCCSESRHMAVVDCQGLRKVRDCCIQEGTT